MNIRKENSLKLMVYLLLIVVLEILSYSEAKVIQKQYGLPIFAPVINIILVPYLTFIMGREIEDISGIRKEILKGKKEFRLILKCLQIVFLLVEVYIVLISFGRVIGQSDFINSYSSLYLNLYAFTKTEFYVVLILIFILSGFGNSVIKDDNN